MKTWKKGKICICLNMNYDTVVKKDLYARNVLLGHHVARFFTNLKETSGSYFIVDNVRY